MITVSKIIVSIILINLLPIAVNARQYIEVKNEKDFKNEFSYEMGKYNETFSKKVKSAGIIFIKFRINEEGNIDSIKFSVKQPDVLINGLSKELKKFKIVTTTKPASNMIYVLPIFYDYLPDPKIIKTVEDLEDQVEFLDPAQMLADMTYDFNGFFKEEESEKDLWGIKCTFLPMINLIKIRIYH